jgi:predicted solute-binding protein
MHATKINNTWHWVRRTTRLDRKHFTEKLAKHESWIEISELSIQDDYTMMMRIQDEVDYFSDLADKFPRYFNVKMIGLYCCLTEDENFDEDLLDKFESREEKFESHIFRTAQQLVSLDLRLVTYR